MLITILDYAGTLAFAMSGIRMASHKQFDYFGAYMVGLVTAIGGGTLRDILLDVTPFWMTQPSYLVLTAVALLLAVIFRTYLNKINRALFIFDTVGLAFFMIVGLEKTLTMGYPNWVAIGMGMLTGAAGGIMRDILINEIPLLFRKEIYALACIIGGIVYVIIRKIGFDPIAAQLGGACTVFLVRNLAVKYRISLPRLKSEDEEKEEKEIQKKKI